MQFLIKTPLAEVRELKSLSKEVSRIVDILIPEIDTYGAEATVHDLGPRNAYNASISLDLLLREHCSGRRILYLDQKEKSAKETAALMCFEQNSGAPWLLVLPAAEEAFVPAAKSSGVPIAFETVKYGVNTAVLRYSAGLTPAEFSEQITEAVEILQQRGAQRVALVGFANGGNAALRWASENKEKAFTVICASAPAADVVDVVDEGFPPVYIIHGAQDELAPPQNAQILSSALEAKGIKHRLWIVPDAKNNFGKGHNTMADGWLEAAVAFCLESMEGNSESR